MGKKSQGISKLEILRKAFFSITLFLLVALPLVEASASLLDDKRAELNRLQGRVGEVESMVNAQAEKANTLKNQIALMNGQITQVKLRIKLTQTKIEEANLAIGELSDQISQKQIELANQEAILSQAIKYIYEEGETPFIETLFSSISFSEILDRTEYLETAEMKVEKTITEIERLKRELEEKKQEQEEKRKELQKLNHDLILQRKGLEEDIVAKNSLLAETKGREAAYQKKVNTLEARAQAVQDEMARAEQANRGGGGGKLGYCPSKPSTFNFDWPTTCRGAWCVTCDYYCYRGHSGVDFPAGDGIARAAAAGRVVYVRNWLPPWFHSNTPHYGNYVEIIHDEGFVTRYAHLRSVAVRDNQRVSSGQGIGRIGSTGFCMPPGAVHLHFEIRKWGSATNPLCYY